MGLRTILLVISCIIVGLCLSLYFQTGQNVESVNWDQYKNLHYNEERSHSLSDLNAEILPYRIQDIIQEIYQKNRLAGEKTRVMEIGAGNGRVLMELKKLFPEVEFYGINKEKTHTFYRRESFILTALKFGIFNKEELDQQELPYIVFADLDFGRNIPYADNRFDLIFSQETISHIRYKFELFNEILRVLKIDGVSIHTNVVGMNIYSKGVLIDLRDALAGLRRQGFIIKTLENNTSIYFKKTFQREVFPLEPHRPVPTNLNNLSKDMTDPEMNYSISL